MSEVASNKKYTHVIWDFNGTILDDVAHGIRCVNVMLRKRGLRPIPDQATYREVFGFPIKEYYRSLGFDFEREDYYTVLAPEWVALYLAGEPDCPMMDGAAETLRRITRARRCGRGVSQCLISATETGQLLRQLDRLDIASCFDEILGLDNIHASGKKELVQAFAASHPGAVPLFVGDTEHDAEVADAIGADCVLYTGGHQSEKRLSRLGKPLIRHISELCAWLDIEDQHEDSNS